MSLIGPPLMNRFEEKRETKSNTKNFHDLQVDIGEGRHVPEGAL